MILLDTHVLLWWLADDPALSPPTRDLIGDPRQRIAVSAASVFEIETKRRLGKLRAPSGLLAALDSSGIDPLALDPVSAELAGSLDWSHRDPFDRLLVAHARTNKARLLTADQRILAFEPTALAC